MEALFVRDVVPSYSSKLFIIARQIILYRNMEITETEKGNYKKTLKVCCAQVTRSFLNASYINLKFVFRGYDHFKAKTSKFLFFSCPKP